jgi:GT2 family glycosyltransferase
MVYILIVNWNQAELTNECLMSVYHSEGVRFRVLIVDNGSTDDSQQQRRARIWAIQRAIISACVML